MQMPELYNYLHGIGAKWAYTALIASLVGMTLFILAHRRYYKAVREAHHDQLETLREGYNDRVQLMQELIEQLKLVKDSVTEERDTYWLELQGKSRDELMGIVQEMNGKIDTIIATLQK